MAKVGKNGKIRVICKEISEGVYQPEYKCPPHVGYFANMILHWRCEFCGKLAHEKPKTWLTTESVERVYPNNHKSVALKG